MDRLLALLPLVLPAWILAALLAGLNISLFQSVVGRERRAALLFIPFGILGFAFGNMIATLLNSPLPTLGDIHLIEASTLAWLFMTVVNARIAD
jgi:flagellar biosynthesis protein FliQ